MTDTGPRDAAVVLSALAFGAYMTAVREPSVHVPATVAGLALATLAAGSGWRWWRRVALDAAVDWDGDPLPPPDTETRHDPGTPTQGWESGGPSDPYGVFTPRG
jgi:hypothetical protein